MTDLNNILISIIKEHKDVNLFEDNGDEVSNILEKNKIKFNYIKFPSKVNRGDMLILYIRDSSIINHYDELGKLLLTFEKGVIIIRKISSQDYITDSHNLIMSLGFMMHSQISNDNLFYFFYVYNIGTYKKTPDWLNNENWANPELWEK